MNFQITSGVVEHLGIKGVVYGVEGIGKSTFVSNLPDPVFIDTEGSTSKMNVRRLPKPSSWEMLNQEIDYVKQSMPCKSLIIDTIDWAERLAIENICQRASKGSITGFGYGEGFIQLEEEFGKFLNKLSDLTEVGINVFLTAHAKITKFEQPDEMGAYDRYELKLGNKTTAKTSSLVKEWADMVLFANYKTYSVAVDKEGKKHKAQGGQRVMYTTHHPCWDAKNRFNLPDECPFSYDVIRHILDGQSQTPPMIQQPQQVFQETFGMDLQKEFANQTAPMDIVDDEQQPLPAETADPFLHTEFMNPVQQPAVQSQPSLDPRIPAKLRDLMVASNVSEQDIQNVVGFRGYFPSDMKVGDYPAEFIDDILVAAWSQVFSMILEQKNMQF